MYTVYVHVHVQLVGRPTLEGQYMNEHPLSSLQRNKVFYHVALSAASELLYIASIAADPDSCYEYL